MKIVPTLTVSVLLASATLAIAQSGRQTQPAATSVPSAAPDKGRYSESGPSRAPASGPVRKDNLLVVKNEGEVIRIDTDLVTVPVSVFDRNGLYVPNLGQADFDIFEDGVEQVVAYFATTEKPVTIVLLLDTSPSTSYKIDEIRNAAIAFVDQLKLQDSVMVIEFDGNVHVLTEVTRDRARIYKAIGKADFGFGTSLYEAVDFTLRKRLNSIEGRKAIVLFTDGVDTTSRKAGLDSTLRLAEEADTLVYPIYYNTLTNFNSRGGFPGVLSSRGSHPEDYALGRRYLEQLAHHTGGRVFRPEGSPESLRSAFEGIAEELRRQYVLGYIPAERGTEGQRKQIRVRVYRPDLILRSRDSSIVGNAVKPAERR